ncbi:carbohydrate ABC transporter membrane protein 2 (CUT1 family) [Hydrogenispora ethanolica]|uniref:Carbohydrate ABC transporter membrane protein 2 (CUT1 family) n=1 Tax=Hydrogenispora ethanolica TaxID=1082276 RepID=A0A4R1RUK8_HYDET|nr:carbohydrate ABC transporter permease [Hydrogenispora ethanolica]TCL70089.1 carbohydrate ABC transporter membrane protein 2 (CUT1 family) [Hydrogenispora ethanolica]
MNKQKILERTAAIVINLIVMLMSLSCIFPIIWVIYSSFKTNQEFNLSIVALPSHLDFSNYAAALRNGHIDKYFFNSVFTTSVTVALIILISFVTGYFLSRFQFKGRNLLYIMFLSGMLIPAHSLLIPLFIQFKHLGLLNTRVTLLFPYISLGLPMAVFLFESFIKTIPFEMEEAATIDGVPYTRMLFQIIFPICRPIVATVIILSFLQWWNEFPFALVLISSDMYKTIPIGLSNFIGPMSSVYTELMAAMVIAILPVIVVYLAFSKKIIQGMTMGAVKG